MESIIKIILHSPYGDIIGVITAADNTLPIAPAVRMPPGAGDKVELLRPAAGSQG